MDLYELGLHSTLGKEEENEPLSMRLKVLTARRNPTLMASRRLHRRNLRAKIRDSYPRIMVALRA